MEKPRYNINKRNFVFLQGPIGPFFSMLSRELKLLGHGAFSINFWGGDYIYNPNGINYTGTPEDWSKFFSSFCIKNKITDIILFGDRRIYHEKAIEAVCQLNSQTKVWVLEEGYFRPHWVTVDKYGANFRSSINTTDLFNTKDFYGQEDKVQHIKPWIKESLVDIGKYYLAGLISKPIYFSNFRYHRLQHPLIEMAGWISKWIATHTNLKDDEMKVLKASSKLQNHFVLALQLETDSQIRMYSPFKSMNEVMRKVMSSFKNHAPAGTNLIVKSHPFDEKWISREKEFLRLAKEFDIEDRVAFIDTCNVSSFLDNSLGLVTTNSSLSLFALENNIPVLALGKAFWDIKGITNQKDINEFWSNPERPDMALFGRLKSEIMKTQINGNFYSEEGRAVLLPKIVEHIINEPQDTQALTEKVLKRIKENNSQRVTSLPPIRNQKIDLKV